jgi:hypothetical protein
LLGYVSTRVKKLPKLPFQRGDTLAIHTPIDQGSNMGSYQLNGDTQVSFPWPRDDTIFDDDEEPDTWTVKYAPSVTKRQEFVVDKLVRSVDEKSEIEGKEPVDIHLTGTSLIISSDAQSPESCPEAPLPGHCKFTYGRPTERVQFQSVGDMDAYTTNGGLHSTSHIKVSRNLRNPSHFA